MTADRDISRWYDQGDHALQSQLDAILHKEVERQTNFLWPRFQQAHCQSLLEFGPGAGLLASALTLVEPELVYLGVEKSQAFLRLAQERSRVLRRGLAFVPGDVRTWRGAHFDCVCAFKFLKHFGIEEWDVILRGMLDKARYAAFDVQLLDRPLDNGTHWPHVFVREKDVLDVLAASGHEEVSREVWGEGEVPGAGKMQNVVFWTRKG